MITNDAELEVVRRQLAHVDAAIDDIRRNVLPKSEQMFNLLTEAPVELRESLQAEIDAYLGVTKPNQEDTFVPGESTESTAADRT
jgi:hypothetical protein